MCDLVQTQLIGHPCFTIGYCPSGIKTSMGTDPEKYHCYQALRLSIERQVKWKSVHQSRTDTIRETQVHH